MRALRISEVSEVAGGMTLTYDQLGGEGAGGYDELAKGAPVGPAATRTPATACPPGYTAAQIIIQTTTGTTTGSISGSVNLSRTNPAGSISINLGGTSGTTSTTTTCVPARSGPASAPSGSSGAVGGGATTACNTNGGGDDIDINAQY